MPRVDTIRLSASSLAVSSLAVLSLGLIGAPLAGTAQAQESGAYSSLVASHAAAHGLPPSLVHRVIMRESRYNSRAVSKGNYGIMQIRLGTARAMGYTGSAAGLLDPNVNMTYAVKYLAGAYRAAGGNADRAVALYASGYGGRAARVSPEARAAYASAYGYERGSRRGRAAANPAPVGALAQEVR